MPWWRRIRWDNVAKLAAVAAAVALVVAWPKRHGNRPAIAPVTPVVVAPIVPPRAASPKPSARPHRRRRPARRRLPATVAARVCPLRPTPAPPPVAHGAAVPTPRPAA